MDKRIAESLQRTQEAVADLAVRGVDITPLQNAHDQLFAVLQSVLQANQSEPSGEASGTSLDRPNQTSS